MSKYPIYKALEQGEFRLITILNVDGLPECMLENVSLKDTLEYNTLSYSWGNQSPTAAIVCNGDSFSVTPHLSEAFAPLHSYLGPLRKIWIDAICINQQDNEEKNIQVRLMRDIYKNAQAVLVWLGNAADDSDMAMDQALELNEKLSSIARPIHFDHLAYHDLNKEGDLVWPALGHFYCRSWFERLWVVQEAVLARELVLLCGSRSIDWESLTALTTALLQTGLLHLVMAAQEIRRDRDNGFYTIPYINILRMKIAEHGGMDFQALVSGNRCKKCTEPVDRLWSMLGLVHPHVRNEIPDLVSIDYSEDGRRHFWRPYIALAKRWIEEDSTLMLLSRATSQEKPKELPSWCPNWASPEEYSTFGSVYTYQAGFRSTEDRSPRVSVIPDSNNIQVRGFDVDEVADIVSASWSFSQFPDQQKGLDGAAAKLLEWESQCVSLSKVTYKQLGAVPEAHWRTLIGNKIYDEDPTPVGDVSEDYHNMLRYLITLRDGTFLDEGVEKKTALRLYFSAQQSACQGRRFFSTRGGRVGLGPAQLKAGDTICVFYSGGPLYALRFKHADKVAELIGEAYVHGLMNKEAFTAKGRGEDQTFVIC